MSKLVALLFVLPLWARASESRPAVTPAEREWIAARNANHGHHGYPAGFGLRPEDYAVGLPALDSNDNRFEELCRELGRGLFVAFTLRREGRAAAAVNERKHLGKILARLNMLAPEGEADRATFEAELARSTAVHLRRAAAKAGLDLSEARRLFFEDMQYHAFDARNLKRATDQVLAEWKANTWEASAWRWAQWGVPATLIGSLAYGVNNAFLQHADGELVVLWAIATLAYVPVAWQFLPYTAGLRFKQKLDHVTPALKTCQGLLTGSDGSTSR